jgi:hypothetical protein
VIDAVVELEVIVPPEIVQAYVEFATGATLALRPVVNAVTTFAAVICGPAGAFTVTLLLLEAVVPAAFVTAQVINSVPLVPEVRATLSMIAFVPAPELTTGVAVFVPLKVHAYVIPLCAVTLALKLAPAVTEDGADTDDVGAGTMVTVLLPVTFLPAPFVAEQFTVNDGPVPAENVMALVVAPAVMVPPLMVQEYVAPVCGTLALNPVALCVAYCGAVIVQLGSA